MAPEQTLWRAIFMRVLQDALINASTPSQGGTFNAIQAFKWIRSEDGKRVCDYANIDYDAAVVGFKRIINESITKNSLNLVDV